MPISRPEPIRPTWSIGKYSQLAAAALAVVLVGALVAALAGGIFDNRGGNEGLTAIPAAVAQVDATPAAIGTPTAANDSILWTLPSEGTNVEIGGTAVADGTLYRLIRSDEFTGVQAVDTATGTEKWRSAQEVSGTGLGADANGVYLPIVSGVVALDPATGEQRWSAVTQSQPWSLAVGNGRAYVWDGQSTLAANELIDGSVAWQGIADVDTASSSVLASQPPAVTVNGIAAVSGTGVIALFDTDGNFTGTAGHLQPESVELAATADGSIAIAGAAQLETDQPWARKLILVDPADGSTVWETDYNALVTGLTVTGDMALILADNPGLAVTELQFANAEGTVTTEQANPYPEQTSPQIYGYDLATGQMYFSSEGDPSDYNWSAQGWVTDKGSSPYVALETGPTGPIAISESGQIDFYSVENPLVQAVASLPGVLPNETSADDTAVYASTDDGSLTAIAPQLAGLEPQSFTPSGNLNWSLPVTGALVDFGGMAYTDGLVYRLIDTGSGRQIEATYAATGQPAWTLPFDWSTSQIVSDLDTTDFQPNQAGNASGNIFVVDTANRLIALNGVSGTVGWQHAFEDPVVSMVADNGTLYVWDESGTMTALLPQDGTLLWATASGAPAGAQSNELGMPVPAMTRTVIAMVDANGTLHGFDKELGTLLWSTPGFDSTNTRIVRQGNAEWDQTEIFVVVSATGPQRADGSIDLVVSGVLAANGERSWDSSMQGPLVQPVNTDETLVVVTGDQLVTGKNVPTDSTPVVDGEPYNHYDWTGTGEIAPDGGGNRLFALDAASGQIVWIRTTATGGFTALSSKFPTGSGTLYAVTSDGLLVSPNRGNGAIDGEPTNLGGPVIAITPSGETGAIGSFATLADGTLVAFGGMPFSQQG
jgi:outer membrane protein assembly factor BamB